VTGSRGTHCAGHHLCAWLAAGFCLVATQGLAEPPREWITRELPTWLEHYRWFHQHPELSLEEQETARYFADRLEEQGFSVTRAIGGHGVVGLLTNGSGPTLMLRTELDGLPVTEKTDLAFASNVTTQTIDGRTTGVMHACGHDLHMAAVLAAGAYLADHRDQWAGTLMVIGQPAEERVSGARAMLNDGLFTRFPKPDFAIALHCDSAVEAGQIHCRGGYVLANSDSVDIVMYGRGGHGSTPHLTIDPIVQAAQLVLDLQTIISREIDPQSPAVITVGAIQGGTKHNIIGDSCRLQLTVRSYDDQVREQLFAAIRRKAQAVAASHRAPEPKVTMDDGVSALQNDPQLAQRLQAVLIRTLGEENVGAGKPQMGAEDFSEYGRAGVPVVMYRLGTVSAQRLARYAQLGVPPPSLHAPDYFPDAEPSLQTAVTALITSALDLL